MNPAVLFATGLGAGYFPVASGTMGSLWALVLLGLGRFLVPWTVPAVWQAMALAVLVCGGAVLCTAAEKTLGHDSSKIVLDEMAGMWIAMAFIPWRLDTIILAFILFRFFDVMKTFPINRMEKLPGGWGVMLDDVLAGIFSNILVRVYLKIPGLVQHIV
jgi:phosphatidylglycerophosphatase A